MLIKWPIYYLNPVWKYIQLKERLSNQIHFSLQVQYNYQHLSAESRTNHWSKDAMKVSHLNTSDWNHSKTLVTNLYITILSKFNINIFLTLIRWINNNAICWSPEPTRHNVQVTWWLQEALSLSVQKTSNTWNAPNTFDSARVEQVGVWSQRSSWPDILFAPRDWNYSRFGPSGLRNVLVLTSKNDKELKYTSSPLHTVGHQNII